MNTPVSNDDCCSGTADATPLPVTNPPGLATAAYRIGAQADFKAAMLDALSRADAGPLRALQTRADDDPTIALIDAWATTLDVLTFYQERLANESWLGTATARRSVLDLAALVGYAPRPGLAAEAALVFTLEDAAGAPASVTLDPGVAVQSVPAPGEQPVTFETAESIELRPEWNAVKTRCYEEFTSFDIYADFYWVKTAKPGVKPGDLVLVICMNDNPYTGESFCLRCLKHVTGVTLDAANDRAKLDVQDYFPVSISRDREESGIIVLGTKAGPFGHNAPRPQPQPRPPDKTPISDWEQPTWDNKSVLLDREIEGIPAHARVVAAGPLETKRWFQYTLGTAAIVSPAQFGISGRVTQLSFDDPAFTFAPWTVWGNDFQTYRDTTIYIETRRLPMSGPPILEASGNSLLLDRDYSFRTRMASVQGWTEAAVYPAAFQSGRRWIVRGQTTAGVDAVELASVLQAQRDKDSPATRCFFTRPLANTYRNFTVTAQCNVVRATHGETVGELLGSGDGGQPWQQFTLRQAPLTYVGAATADGRASTLAIQANGMIWTEVPSFIDAGPNDRVFTTAPDENGRTVVRFGDGRTGARLPSGVNNVRAVYRKGSGAAGNVGAGQLTLLNSRPAGVRAVTNPLPATDGVDPEGRDDARANVPNIARTLGRVVSLRDHADFARAFAGIARADATEDTGGVLLSVLGPGGADLGLADPAVGHLAAALRQLGDPTVPVRIVGARRLPLTFGATLRIDPAWDRAGVLAAARAALLARFGFDARDFRQILVRLDLLAVLQATPGVVTASITRFDFPGDPDSHLIWPDDHQDGKPLPAWMIWLDDAPLRLTRRLTLPMPYDADTLYALLPQYLRLRDAREGSPLRALVGVLAGQAQLLDENIAQLYDDLFIETCADWVAPYLGTLLGVNSLQPAGDAVSPRAEVANTVGYRRRKGTALVLEQLARDVTGWPARAVEFYDRLATTQFLNATRPGNLSFASVRGVPRPPDGSAFDTTPRTADVRRIGSGGTAGWNLPNVGLFVWRLSPHSLTSAIAAPGPDPASFFAHPAGVDAPLIRLPDEETEWTQLAEERHLPMPITRRALAEDLRSATPSLYGADRSIFLEWLDGDPAAGGTREPVPVEHIRAADLSDTPHGWATQPAAGDVAIDPQLGRIRFGTLPAGKVVLITCQHGFGADLGGGEYDRASTLPGDADVSFGPRDKANSVLSALTGNTIVEFTGSGQHPDLQGFTLPPRSRIVLRAANETRPSLFVPRTSVVAAPDGGELELNGLLMVGGPLRITGTATRVRIVHCTFVPGRLPSLIVAAPDCVVEIEASIVGSVHAVPGTRFQIVESIVDATSPELNAFCALDGQGSGGTLSLDRTTVIGRVRAGAVGLITNSIIHARPGPGAPTVVCDRLQTGCVRYSLVPPDARTPRRFNCLPMAKDDPAAFRPAFTSLRYGQGGYAQLGDRTPFLLRIAADDRSEPGAFHDNFQPQREANLRTRLDEYLRFGLQAGLIHAT